jgi:hypothetical protein
MRAALAALLTLAACGPAPSPPTTSVAAGPALLEGEFSATSNTAMGVTGDLTATPVRLSFSKGYALATAAHSQLDVATPIGEDEESFLVALSAPGSTTLELRRVTQDLRPADIPIDAPCGAAAPTFVALAYATPPTTVTMAVFSGPDAPGPDAVNSALCGTFRYDRAPDQE